MCHQKHKSIRALAPAILLLLSGCVPGPVEPTPDAAQATPDASASVPAAPSARPPRVVPGEFLVKLKPGLERARMESFFKSSGAHEVRAFASVPGLRLVRSGSAGESAAVMSKLGQFAEVEYVEPNFIWRSDAIPNDPMFTKQWPLLNTGQITENETSGPDIDAVSAWEITTGSQGVVVAVVDSGVDYTHEDLAPNIFRNEADCNSNGVDDDGNGYVDDCHGIDTSEGDSDPMDPAGHGTHVAGIIGAVGNNGIGIAGVAWNLRLLPCRFLDSDGEGSTAGAIACLDYIAAMRDRGINIVAANHSWGGVDYSRALEEALIAQQARGILSIVAAGNGGTDNDTLPQYPCNYEVSGIICVAWSYDNRDRYSNYGTGTVHIAAPGTAVWSTVPGNDYDVKEGTSMAAPHVSGVVALLESQSPTRSWRALKNLVLAGAVPQSDGQPIRTATGGRLNALHSLTCSDREVLARLRPGVAVPLMRAIGDTVDLSVLHIRCGEPAGTVLASISPAGQTVELLDDGVGADRTANDGVYSGTWTADTAGRHVISFPFPETDEIVVEVDPLLERGFPASTLALADLFEVPSPPRGGVLVGNIDADPRLEIVHPGVNYGPLYAWHHDGSSVAGWPRWDAGYAGEASLAELDGDRTSLELASVHFIDGVWAHDGSGVPMPGWPQFNAIPIPPAIVDLDGDGRDEIIAQPARYADGSLIDAVSTFPQIDLPENGPTWSAAAADLDVDGEVDIVRASRATLFASNRRGAVPGFPVTDPRTYGQTLNFPVIGDVDGDGRLNIILTTPLPNTSSAPARIHVLDADGTWLKTISSTAPAVNNKTALADMDADGIPEMILADAEYLHVWNGQGQELPGWPARLGPPGWSGGAGGAVVGDIGGDSAPEIVVIAGGFAWGEARLLVFDHHGIAVEALARTLPSSNGFSTPAIADIDGDGRNEIIVATTRDMGYFENVFAFDLGGPAPHGPLEWPQHMGGADRRGYYETGKNLPAHAYLSVQVFGTGSIRSADGGIDCGQDCIEKYPKGRVLTITATPGAGSTFDRWTGACTGQGNPCTLTISKPTAVAAEFPGILRASVVGTGSGKVVSSPAGIDCPSTCTSTFAPRSPITLTATPAAHHAFDGWSGACTGTNATCTLFASSTKEVVARYSSHRTLTVSIEGLGRVTSTPSGIDCTATCTHDFEPGQPVTLTFEPDPDHYQGGWTFNCVLESPRTCAIVMARDETVAVNFPLKPLLTIDVTGKDLASVISSNLGIDCGERCAARVEPDTLVEVSAQIVSPDLYATWETPCSGIMRTCTFFMRGDTVAKVTLRRNPTLHLDLRGQGEVMIETGMQTHVCTASTCDVVIWSGDSAKLTAMPQGTARFTGWNGACAGSAPSCTLTVTASTSVTAVFEGPGSGGSGGNGGGGGGGGGGSGGGSLSWELPLLLLMLLATFSAPNAPAMRWRSRRPR